LDELKKSGADAPGFFIFYLFVFTEMAKGFLIFTRPLKSVLFLSADFPMFFLFIF
jgi:hypothetical protein